MPHHKKTKKVRDLSAAGQARLHIHTLPRLLECPGSRCCPIKIHQVSRGRKAIGLRNASCKQVTLSDSSALQVHNLPPSIRAWSILSGKSLSWGMFTHLIHQMLPLPTTQLHQLRPWLEIHETEPRICTHTEHLNIAVPSGSPSTAGPYLVGIILGDQKSDMRRHISARFAESRQEFHLTQDSNSKSRASYYSSHLDRNFPGTAALKRLPAAIAAAIPLAYDDLESAAKTQSKHIAYTENPSDTKRSCFAASQS